MKRKQLLISGVVIMMMVVLTGCSNKEAYRKKTYRREGTQVKEIRIDVNDRKVDIAVSNDDFITVDYYESDKEFYDIQLSEDATFTMRSKSEKDMMDYIGGKADINDRTIYLRIPSKLLSALSIITTKESIAITDVSVQENISLSTNGGDIIFNEIESNSSLHLKTKDGDIKGSIIGRYEDYSIIQKIKKGDSNLTSNQTEASKSLFVENNNGDINVQFTEQ